MRPEMLQAAVLAVSLCNAMLLGWLALIVLLNAERRTLALLLPDGALVLGAMFFLFQSAIAGTGFEQLVASMYLQWPAGWLIGLVMVLAWYLSILWHSANLSRRRPGGGTRVVAAAPPAPPAPGPDVRHRHRWWLLVVLVVFLLTVGLALVALPYPWLGGRTAGELFRGPRVGSWPLLALLYPLFVLLCPALAADALLRARPAGPVEAFAHRRARPWLLGTSTCLLLTAALAGMLMVTVAHEPAAREGFQQFAATVIWHDLLISGAVTLAVLCLGQAIVNYEIFIGRSLPREGLRSQWYGAVLLALVYSVAAAESTVLQQVPFFGLIAATILVVTFYALYNWRAAAERERAMALLRPALAGPPLVEALRPGEDPAANWSAPFSAICAQVLGARLAFLVPVGPLAAMAGPPLTYPAGTAPPADVAAIAGACDNPRVTLLALDPADYQGALWALPLWAQSGLIGLLLLGEKRGLGLYGQEELELARAAAERLLDTMAWARMAQRLLELQRRRLAESQVADRRTRRLVHDEVLPRLHAIMLSLGPLPAEQQATLVRELSDVHRELSELLRGLPAGAEAHLARLGLVGALRQALRDEMPEDFEEVVWEVGEEAERELAGLSPLAAEVMYHAAREALRNAARHGRGGEAGRALRVRLGMTEGERPGLVVEDDGVGGAGTGVTAGGGQGIGLHSTMLAVLGGEWITEPAPGGGTRVTLVAPG